MVKHEADERITTDALKPTFTAVAPVYPVDDVEASVEWYGATLGFEAIYVNRDADEDDRPTTP